MIQYMTSVIGGVTCISSIVQYIDMRKLQQGPSLERSLGGGGV